MKVQSIAVWSVPYPAKDDVKWAHGYIAELLRLCPEIEADIMLMRDDYMTEPEIAHWLLDAVGRMWVAKAPRLPPPGILQDGYNLWILQDGYNL